MKLLVNDTKIDTKMIPLRGISGFILQILIQGQQRKAAAIHAQMLAILNGVIDNDQKTDEHGKSEIRLLGYTSLDLIDLLRKNNFKVKEIPIA